MENKDIQSLSDQELVDKITEQKAALIKSKINHNISPVENPIKLRFERRTIARMMTEQTKRKQTKK